MVRICLIFSMLILTSCGNVGGINLGKYRYSGENKDEFVMCHGYNCTSRTYAGFTSKQWESIKRIFRSKSKASGIERQKIAQSIALMEKYTSRRIGTERDQAKAPIFKESDYELDCIDETVNTSKFLEFLQEAELLKHHKVGRPAYRGIGSNFMYPHNTATIVENDTGVIYVVDSYVYANAVKPDIRLLDDWRKTRIEDVQP